MTQIFMNIPKGHTLVCGWNSHAAQVVAELQGAGRSVAVIAREHPDDLKDPSVAFIKGNCSDEGTLKQAGVMSASAAVILAELADSLSPDTVDARSILAALAIESLRPEVFSVVELLNPENERHARNAHVDEIVFCNRLIAEFIALCASQRGISGFVNDLFSHSSGRSTLDTMDIAAEWDGRTVGELFNSIIAQGDLPVAITSPNSDGIWKHVVNPDASRQIKLPMKAICIRRRE